ncbi:MAG: tetratricopeptide repeat protein [Pseudomonadota bacterium]|nr:tetratricopeptide repeat protein [Pseudomonadota bacterium]
MSNEAHRIFTLLLSGLLLSVPVPLVAAAGDRQPGGEVALAPIMAGEFALQAGKLDEAAHHYLQAARASGDAELAARATRIALLAGDMPVATAALALWQRHAPPSLDMHTATAMLALRQGRRGKALAALETLLADPAPEGGRNAWMVLSSAGTDNPDAAWLLQRLYQRGRLPLGDLSAVLPFARLAQLSGRMQLSGQILDAAAANFPADPRILLLQASLAAAAGDKAAASGKLAQARTRIDDQPLLRIALAQEYERIGQFGDAEQVLAAGPQNLQIQAMRAGLLERAGNRQGLEALYRQMQPPPADAEPRYRLLLGQMAEMLRQYPAALEWYDSIRAPEWAHLLQLRRAVVLHAQGRKEEGYAQLRALQNSAPAEAARHGSDGGSDPRRDGFLAEAELRQQDGDREGELDAYARGLMALPDDIDILYAQALAWERFDDIGRAEASLRKILLIAPDNVAALNALGYTLADRTNRYREALALIDRARVAEPDNGAIIDSHGWVLYRLGRHREALVQLKRAFSLHRDAEVAAHIAEVLWMMGRRDEARRYFEEARRIDPEHRALKRALQATGAGP